MPNMSELPVLNLRASLKKPLQWAFLAAIATAVITLFVPNDYRSEARILPVEAKGVGGLGNLATAAAAFGMAIPGGEGLDANFVDMLNSRTLKESLLTTEFRFHARIWRFGADTLHQETLYHYLDEKNMDRAVKKLSTVLSASRDLKSKVITVSAETRSPELSQQVVRHATALLEQFVQTKNRTRGGEKAAFAEARLADARQQMGQAEASFRHFLEANRNYQVSSDPAVRLHGARLEAELNLRRQLITTIAMNREQSLMEEKNDMPILNVLDQGNLPIDKSKPSRSVIVLLVTLLAGLGSWAWLNREWIRERLLADDDESPTTHKERLV